MIIALAFILSLPSTEVSKPNTAAEQFHLAAIEANPPLMPPARVAKLLKAKRIVLVDLRSAEEFSQSHLQGAINIPATDLTDEKLAKLIPDRQSKIVTYCDNTLFPTRRIAITSMTSAAFYQLGYEQVYVLQELYLAKECRSKPPQLGQPCPAHLQMVDGTGKLLQE
jgi:rhodanese-related sulfurtransferase